MRQLVTSPPVVKQEVDRKWDQAKKLQDPNPSEYFLYLGPTSRSPVETKCSNIVFLRGCLTIKPQQPDSLGLALRTMGKADVQMSSPPQRRKLNCKDN